MGFLRLLLALSVVAAHTNDMPISFGGRGAVCLFYMISGFYMGLILNEKYTGKGANKAFYLSRFLRLWVPYIAVITCIGLGLLFSGDWTIYREAYAKVPPFYGLFAGLSNIFILGQDILWFFSSNDAGKIVYQPMGQSGFNGAELALDSPLFSVSLELYFYLLAPFILRNKKRAFLFAFTGLIYHHVLEILNIHDIAWIYHFFPSTIAYFGLGAVLYHLSVVPTWKERDGIFAGILFAMSATLDGLVPRQFFLPFIVLLPFIFHLTKKNVLDRWLGELSYGVYIIHYPLLRFLGKLDPPFGGFGQFLSLTVFSILLSILLHHGLEVPLTRLRTKITTDLLRRPSIRADSESHV